MLENLKRKATKIVRGGAMVAGLIIPDPAISKTYEPGSTPETYALVDSTSSKAEKKLEEKQTFINFVGDVLTKDTEVSTTATEISNLMKKLDNEGVNLSEEEFINNVEKIIKLHPVLSAQIGGMERMLVNFNEENILKYSGNEKENQLNLLGLVTKNLSELKRFENEVRKFLKERNIPLFEMPEFSEDGNPII